MTNYEWLNGMNIIQREKEITKWYNQAKIKLVLYSFLDWLQQEREEKLKPCPFCGQTPDVFDVYGDCSVKCMNDNCSVRPKSSGYMSKSEAIKEWNKRVGDE